MIDTKFIDEISRRVSDALPHSARELSQDLEKNVRAVLHSGFQRLDLVSREEFDVQSAVLARTRAKLEALEAQVAELERQLDRR